APPSELRFIDAETLKPTSTPAFDLRVNGSGTGQLRCSANGRLISSWNHSQRRFQLLLKKGERYVSRTDRMSCDVLLPTPDGQYVLTPTGAYTNRIHPAGFGKPGRFMIPAVRGPFYLSAQMP